MTPGLQSACFRWHQQRPDGIVEKSLQAVEKAPQTVFWGALKCTTSPSNFTLLIHNGLAGKHYGRPHINLMIQLECSGIIDCQYCIVHRAHLLKFEKKYLGRNEISTTRLALPVERGDSEGNIELIDPATSYAAIKERSLQFLIPHHGWRNQNDLVVPTKSEIHHTGTRRSNCHQHAPTNAKNIQEKLDPKHERIDHAICPTLPSPQSNPAKAKNCTPHFAEAKRANEKTNVRPLQYVANAANACNQTKRTYSPFEILIAPCPDWVDITKRTDALVVLPGPEVQTTRSVRSTCHKRTLTNAKNVQDKHETTAKAYPAPSLAHKKAKIHSLDAVSNRRSLIRWQQKHTSCQRCSCDNVAATQAARCALSTMLRTLCIPLPPCVDSRKSLQKVPVSAFVNPEIQQQHTAKAPALLKWRKCCILMSLLLPRHLHQPNKDSEVTAYDQLLRSPNQFNRKVFHHLPLIKPSQWLYHEGGSRYTASACRSSPTYIPAQ
ncbi:hypothetical protein e1004f01.tmp0061 [Eimeria tenella]|uniref:Uncharacterized protein n=1 Tax=Eimeria tenella TaxID=5802 RepID=C8TE20_EIMTE|nr:hypothetical protein e1004f01.tmp0061 [Eimeria tenella]